MPHGMDSHRLTQFGSVSAQPLARVAIPGAGRCDQAPVGRGVIEPLEVHQLMNDDVIANPLWHGDEPPIEAHVPVTPARTPPRPLIADADARDRQTVCVSELPQPLRELRLRLRAKSPSVVGGKAAARQHRPLPQDPFDVALREGIGLPARSSARNRDADTAIVFDAEQVSARATMTHEVDWCNRAGGWRREGIVDHRRPRSGLAERKPQLHDDRIPDSPRALDNPSGADVISITLVRGT
jgi:hypothetical protein